MVTGRRSSTRRGRAAQCCPCCVEASRVATEAHAASRAGLNAVAFITTDECPPSYSYVVEFGSARANWRCRLGGIALSRVGITTAVGTVISPIHAREEKRLIAAAAPVISARVVLRS